LFQYFSQFAGLSPIGERIVCIRDEDLSTCYSASCLVSLDEKQPTFVMLRDSSNTQVAFFTLEVDGY